MLLCFFFLMSEFSFWLCSVVELPCSSLNISLTSIYFIFLLRKKIHTITGRTSKIFLNMTRSESHFLFLSWIGVMDGTNSWKSKSFPVQRFRVKEEGENGKLRFQDVLVTRQNTGLHHIVYRKQTRTDPRPSQIKVITNTLMSRHLRLTTTQTRKLEKLRTKKKQI